jgi:hypothetical protein
MIDWIPVSFNALWITGLGLVTAGLSLANYLGSKRSFRFSQALKTPTCRIMVYLGIIVFCLGLAGSVSALWEKILWGLLAIIFIIQIWLTRKLANS